MPSLVASHVDLREVVYEQTSVLADQPRRGMKCYGYEAATP